MLKKTGKRWLGLSLCALLFLAVLPLNSSSEAGPPVVARSSWFDVRMDVHTPVTERTQVQGQLPVPQTPVGSGSTGAQSQAQEDTVIAGRYVIRLQPGTDPEAVAAPAGAKVIRRGPLNFATLALPAGREKEALAILSRQPGVLKVEPSHLLKAAVLPAATAATTTAAATTPAPSPNLQTQWGLSTIEAPKAWSLGAAGKGITIAIIDTGVDYNHPDLTDNLLSGYNAINGSTAYHAAQDNNGHGTHVAGIAAADGKGADGDGTGIYGVAYAAKILPVKAMNRDGEGLDDVIADGIVWAADHGANIINLSLGSNAEEGILGEAINYAADKGCLVIAAAGNSDQQSSGIAYPAADPNVLAVTATDENDRITSFSLTGPQAGVAAPGADIYSTYWDNGSAYGELDGTSMASPFAAGTAALVWSLHPTWTARQVKLDLENSALDLGDQGRDNDYGYGRIDAYWAVQFAANPAQYTSPANLTWAGGTVRAAASAGASLQVPARAFGFDPNQNVTASVVPAQSPADFPAGILPGSAAVSVQWNSLMPPASAPSLTPQRMLSLTVNLQPPSGPAPRLAYLYRWSGSRWIQVGGGVNSPTVTVGIFESGIYRAGYAPLPPATRLAGTNRMETAVQIAQTAFPTGADTVILARADEFPDALAGAPLAYKDHAPILLTATDQLPTDVFAEIQALSPQTVILLGGEGAISGRIAAQLQASYQVQRIDGPNRYATAAAIARNLGTVGKGVVVNGENFPDAISMAAVAARQGLPVILTPATALAPEADKILRQLDVSQTIVAGGEGVVTPDTVKLLPQPNRLAGADRYGTAASILAANPPAGALIYVATGANFPDALTGGILAATRGTDIVLLPANGPTTTEQSVLQNWHGLQAIALGGSGVIPDPVLQEVQAFIQ